MGHGIKAVAGGNERIIKWIALTAIGAGAALGSLFATAAMGAFNGSSLVAP